MEIVDIFDKRTQNQLYILKEVFMNHGIVNFKQLSTVSSLDPKTITLLWEDITQYITDDIKLDSKHNYLIIRSQIIKDSWIYQLCSKLLLRKKVNLQDFLNTHYISESKIHRKKKQLNHLISYLQLKIVSKDRHLYLQGKELQIRMLAQQFFWSIFRGIEWPFQEIDFKKIDLFLKKTIFLDHKNLIKEITYMEGAYNFSISLIRFNNGGFIKKDELPNYTKKYFSEFSKLEYIRILLRNEFHFTLEEQYYFLYSLQMNPQYYLDKTFFSQTIKALKKNSIDTLYIYNELIKYFNLKEINLKEFDIAKAVVLAANISATIYHGFYRDISSYLVGEYFEEKSPNLLPNIEKIVLQLKSDNPDISFLNETKYLTIKYSEAYALIKNMFDFEPKIAILVATDTSIIIEELIVKKLTSIFSTYANVIFLTTNSKYSGTYDLVIHTAVTINHVTSDKKLLIADPELTDKDISEIKEKIDKIVKIKKFSNNSL
ncbi:helix-turn-helix domain-containing protein [Vagococcus fluvialis]|uniref:Mga helix-turn-helix domain-containing protein n=1 Tax=Vagococcus fluvialis TaxID=2738 RepID=A0A7X6DA22_9ENTE|nr:helix-turn-helix domain-containing protein [Vagococcus fluvialis]NKC68413.1 hypothetical protein [Vagococcus fluvialis]